MKFSHQPVLLRETIEHLNLKPNGIYVDCTLGAAGHSTAILAAEPTVRLIGIDQDPQALERASLRLAAYTGQVTLVQDNFRNLERILDGLGIGKVDGVLMDIGVSSPQLDDADRGFSYQQDAPLDMRMDPNQPIDAKTIVNTYSAEELTKIIKMYGEERWASRISDFIVRERKRAPLETTGELVDLIKRAIPAKARATGPHPARRTFQALRIAVNDELNALQQGLEQAVEVLAAQGRLAVITFHSLEDRIVKNFFQEMLGKCICPPDFPVCVCGRTPQGRLVTRGPLLPSQEELEDNPRSRSAKLRVLEKL
ncbi:MAG: 16S rRNA (cytosine(1402)-N(4))-methyltransferase RsmH [Firmicutes bacterium]|nr:16S rRNA (cytosine(1402)-N(4))-methyltransferase RsmH [Bacillota bacterium]NLO65768.1 16S rRNA (cytosine(1402)-N(4))-methyltransferase RsmH [Bacillota bacterium]